MLPGQRGHDGQPRYAIPRVPGAPPPPGAAAAAAIAAAREAADLEKAIAEYQGQKFGQVVVKLTPEKPVTEWPDLKHLRAICKDVEKTA